MRSHLIAHSGSIGPSDSGEWHHPLASSLKTYTTIMHIDSGNSDERSFVLLRRRYSTGRDHTFALKGDFTTAARGMLRRALGAIPQDGGSLTIDLRAAVRLDEGCVGALLAFHETQMMRREVKFRLPLLGPAAQIGRLLRADHQAPASLPTRGGNARNLAMR